MIFKSEAKNIKGILDSNEYFARASEFTKRANNALAGRLDTLSLGGKDLNKANPTFTLLKMLFLILRTLIR